MSYVSRYIHTRHVVAPSACATISVVIVTLPTLCMPDTALRDCREMQITRERRRLTNVIRVLMTLLAGFQSMTPR